MISERDYMGLVAQLPCICCNKIPVQVHHVRYAGEGNKRIGMGQEATGYETIPLCPACHAEYHAAPRQFVNTFGSETSLVVRTAKTILERLKRGEM